MIERKPADWAHRGNRSRTSVTGVAYRSDHSWILVQMTNLSYDGCKLLTDQPLDIGEQVQLVMPRRRPINAQVRWTTGEEAGVRFMTNSAADERRARIGV